MYLCTFNKLRQFNPGSIQIPGSKSQSNRMLILAHQTKAKFNSISNLSDSRDTQILMSALNKLDKIKNDIETNVDFFQWTHYQLQDHEVSQLNNQVSNQLQDEYFDFHDAGTPARLILAYFSALGVLTKLTGNDSLNKRSMQPLIDVLESGGAKFEFLQHSGYFPLSITRGLFKFPTLPIDRTLSSQYVSALMLIAPLFPDKKVIHLEGHEHSNSYIRMTQKCLSDCGIHVDFEKDNITISGNKIDFPNQYTIEGDWSSASYFFQVCALNQNSTLYLTNLFQHSCQGDAACVRFFEDLGVSTSFDKTGCLINQNRSVVAELNWDLSDVPDLAPTLIATACALNIGGRIKGIQNLIYKESNRIQAINETINQLGYQICESSESFDEYYLQKTQMSHVPSTLHVRTHADHRIAMAFAPLATKMYVILDDIDCVEKSFPNFWNELKKCNFELVPNESQ